LTSTGFFHKGVYSQNRNKIVLAFVWLLLLILELTALALCVF